MKKALLHLLFIGFSITVFAQDSKVQVLDADNSIPIEEVVIFNNSRTIFEITDAKGNANINLSNTNDSLYFQHPSYDIAIVSFAKIKNNNFKIKLQEKNIQVDLTVISANKTKEKSERISNKIDVLEMKEVELLNPKTSADLLETTGNVFIQKSQGGGGSPIIRGFEANKVLLVVDGVRMNNAIYRGGHLQNAITIDEAMLERVEIVYGPGSLIYGSDALGGVVHYYSKKPKFSSDDKALVKGNASIRYATNNEQTGHFDINVGTKKFASLTSLSFSNFGDTKTGTLRGNKYPDWGKTSFYVNNDEFHLNEKTQIQKRTSYQQIDLMQKFRYKENNYLNFELNTQYSTTSNIDRYDQLQRTTSDIVSDTSNLSFISANLLSDSSFEITQAKFSDWYYGPQERILAAFKVNFNKDVKIHNRATYLLSYQYITESRFKRNFQTDKLTSTNENLNILTFNADFKKDFKETKKGFKNYIVYGLELNYNLVESKGREENLHTGETNSAQSRYPENGSKLFTAAIYGKYNHSFSKKINLSTGVRFNYNSLNSKFSSRSFSGATFSDIKNKNTAVSGSLNFIYIPIENFQINALASTGYRAPNVDDVGKVFEPNNFEIVIPNADLKPEYTFNFELGFVKKFGNQARIDLVGFYTILNNFIQREAFSFKGQDSVFVDDSSEKFQVLANVNSGNAFMTGASLNVKANLVKGLNLTAMFNYTLGRLSDNTTPLSHIPPFFGRMSLDYKFQKLNTSIYTKFAAWKHTWEYSPLSVDNLDEATIDGTPAWATLNFNASYQFNQHFGATFGIENILDSHYRPFGSAISATGRNFVFSLRGKF